MQEFWFSKINRARVALGRLGLVGAVFLNVIALSACKTRLDPGFFGTGLPKTESVSAPLVSYFDSSEVTGTVGTAMSVTPSSLTSSVSLSNCTVSPALPAGLSLDSSTCVISGTPTAPQFPAVEHTITATNSGGSSTATVTITVNEQTPTINYAGSPFTFVKGSAVSGATPTATNASSFAISGGNSGQVIWQQNQMYQSGFTGFDPFWLTSSIPAGTLLLARQNGALTEMSGISDSQGNAWTRPTPGVWYSVLTKPLSVGDSIQFEGASADGLIFLMQFSAVSALRSQGYGNFAPAVASDCQKNDLAILLASEGEEPAAVAEKSGWTRVFYSQGLDWTGNRTDAVDYRILDSDGALTYEPITTGGTGWNWAGALCFATNPSLPPGLTFNTTTGAISGTPTAVSAATNYTVTATNSTGQTASTSISIAVDPCSSAEMSANPFAGAGSANDPYRICTVAQLNRVRNYTASHFELKADLDASGTAFTPIPNFKGSLDGKGHTISNLTISSPSSSFVGFFAKLSGATVKNLILSNLTVSGSSYVGGLAGRIGPASLVSRVSTSGTVTASGGYSGGLAGRAQYARVTQSRSSATVTGADFTGGLLGSCSQFCKLSHSYASGAVTGTTLVGGLVGDLGVGSSVDHVFARGVVTSSSNAALIERAITDDDIAYWDSGLYSLAGSISNAFFDSDLTGTSTFGTGTSGSNPGSSFSSWDSAIWALSASTFPRLKYFDSPSTASEMTEPALTPSLCSNSTPFDGGQGTRSSPFLISSAAQVQNLHCNPQASFRLTSNIDMSGMSYSRPLDYSGQFDGAGHTISNLNIPRIEGVWRTGLFDSLK
ncbi:MAG: putative Ig domain-containing protein, partial [Bdellovibrionales bacterium]|nr:putative Ig domain-containing protein [Bdellovibrionales bacterium]